MHIYIYNLRNLTNSTSRIQGDQKVSVHLMIYCNRQVHRDFLITLYNIYIYISIKI